LEPLGIDGDQVGSCVVVATEMKDVPSVGLNKKIPDSSIVALQGLTKALGDAGAIPSDCGDHIPRGVPAVKETIWREYHYAMKGEDTYEAKRNAHGRARDWLKANCKIGIWNGYVWKVKA
jgi:hypothetical protein